MPAFSFRHVKELYPIFWAKSQEMVTCIEGQLKETTPDNVFEVGEWVSRATLDIIGLAGMGQDFNSLKDPDTKLNRVYRNVFQPSKTAHIIGLLSFLIPATILRALPLQRNDDILAASQLARETSRQLVQAKKEKLQKKEPLSPDIISVALESGAFTDEQLVDHMMTFLAAGHETTASSFIWAIYLMCQNPEVQTKLRKAIHANISSLWDTMDHTKLEGIAYLHAVCNETLRIYAPVPLTLRDTAHDTTILGQFVPKTTKIVIAPWAINHNKQLWGADAEEFNPDRWMVPGQTNSGGAVSNYAFLTFLHGPRSCIGQRFAVAELACLLAAFVGKYEFEMVNPDENIVIKGGLTARPLNGMHIKLKVVEGW
jgi:cytochrome P450